MEGKWTKGPWKVVDELDVITSGREPIEIATCGTSIQEFYETAKANTTLIAQAPTLYEALEAALPKLAHGIECAEMRPAGKWEEAGGSISFDRCCCLIKRIESVLAAARGEKP
ncbi:Uncharacterised protein [uncultured archaeon]|nr:Uncharacterised protein [uncultured archaeon]